MKIKKQGNTTWIQCIQWVHTRPVGWDTIVRKQMENKKTKIEIQKIYDEWSEGTEDHNGQVDGCRVEAGYSCSVASAY